MENYKGSIRTLASHDNNYTDGQEELMLQKKTTRQIKKCRFA